MPTIPSLPGGGEREAFAVNSDPPRPTLAPAPVAPIAAAPVPQVTANTSDAAVAPPAANDETDALKAFLASPQRQAAAPPAPTARASMYFAMDGKPDIEAELRDVSRRTGVPVDSIRAFPEVAKKKAAMQAIDFDSLATDFPNTSKFLSSVDNARIAHDDVQGMSAIEDAVKYVFGAGKRGLATDVAAGAYFGGSAGASGVFRAASEFAAPPLDFLERYPGTGGNPLRRLAEGFSLIGNDASARLKAASPPSGDFIGDAVSSGVQSLGQNLMMMPMALLPGGQAAALTGMSAQAGGQSYQKAREKGVGQNTALLYGASDAVIEFATERLPLGRLIGDLKAGTSLTKSVLHNAALEIPGEQIATVLQDMNEWAVLHPEKPFSAYLAERPSAAAQTLIATVVGTGGNVALVHAIESTVNSEGRAKAVAAQKSVESIKRLTDLSAASKVLARDTETFEAFAQSLTEEGAKDLWISPDALAQSGVADQVMALSPQIAEQVRQSIDSHADIRIPIAEFTGRLSKEGLAQSLVDHVKTEPEGFSKIEADAYMQEHGDTLNAEVEKVLAQRQGDDAFATSRAAVQTDLTNKLNTAGRFTPDVNEAYSTLMANFFATQASRLGVTPEALYQQYTPNIVAQSPLGAPVLDQAHTTLAEVQAAWDGVDIKHSLSEKDGTIEVGRIVVPEAKRNTGLGTAAMRQLIAYADATGQRIVLTPSADFGGTKSRLETFYKSLGFVANKGRSKDFTTMAAMIREPAGKPLEQAAPEPPKPSPENIELRKREAVLKSLLECMNG